MGSWQCRAGEAFDPRYLGIARAAGASPGQVASVVWAIKDCASSAAVRGSVAEFDAQAVADFYGYEIGLVRAIFDACADRGMHDGVIWVGWQSMRIERDPMTPAERARAYRERRKLVRASRIVTTERDGDDSGSVTIERDETSRNVTEARDAVDNNRVTESDETSRQSVTNRHGSSRNVTAARDAVDNNCVAESDVSSRRFVTDRHETSRIVTAVRDDWGETVTESDETSRHGVTKRDAVTAERDAAPRESAGSRKALALALDLSSCSGFTTESPNNRLAAARAGARDVWQAMEQAGAPQGMLARTINSHVSDWIRSGLTIGQLDEAIRRATAARRRSGNPAPINLGFLATFVAEVMAGKPQRGGSYAYGDELSARFAAGG